MTDRVLCHTVTAAEDGALLRTLLRETLGISSSLLARLKRVDGAIRLNGKSVTVRSVVRCGDAVCVSVCVEENPHIRSIDGKLPPLSVLYEDEDILVLDKAAGVYAHRASTAPEAPCLLDAIHAHGGGTYAAHLVNRLDRGTSGVLLAAKSGYVHELLRRALLTGTLRRSYLAVVEGAPSPAEGCIDLPITRAEGSIIKRCVSPHGDAARTRYESVAVGDGCTLVRLFPETGRTHQLRVHMSAIGHPLVGDWLYGTEDRARITRPALHSRTLSFDHPLTHETMVFRAPLPVDMTNLLSNLVEGWQEDDF
ncbi:MAG: RluA family pseudouridine synthase [Oscillospiraceae bacterium]|nr:RluA family pseudouridine synthase [Oscillospiraceae bacterium]